MPADVHLYNAIDDAKCPETWKYYNGYCYKAFHQNDTLQWYEAESKCRTYGGKESNAHLVSILDKKENEILHTFLIHDWKAKQRSLYIGLNDKLKEGVYRWSDGNPMIYTD
ncbi:Aggrecan core protein, partial [Stegodyphus mimosarum]